VHIHEYFVIGVTIIIIIDVVAEYILCLTSQYSRKRKLNPQQRANPMNKLTLLSAVSILVFTSACTTMNQNTGETQRSNTKTGAVAGAAVGALAGVLIGDGVKAAVIGAGVGALAGGGIGVYMDKQEEALREDLEGTGVEVERVGDNIELSMPSNITFATGKAVINPEFNDILNNVGDTLANYESTIVHIAGHTDSTGSAEFNQQLSENRANSVRAALSARGVISERLLTTGYGESLPIADNDTEEGRQENRRVEITLQPVTT
jgi:outer membrane protein OmpA-like peptidoglycan-associated protein